MQDLPQGTQQSFQATCETTKVCALKLGGDFGPEHVRWLAKQVPDIVCISASDIPGVTTIRPEMDAPGWWVKMNAFSPNVISGDVLLIDLDTVVLSLPDMPTQTTVLRDFTEPTIMGSGFMFVTESDRTRVWESWASDPRRHIRENQCWPRWGDQGFLQKHLGDCQKWQDVAQVVSFKAHCQSGVPAGTQVCCFHGQPRPWHVIAPWVPALEG